MQTSLHREGPREEKKKFLHPFRRNWVGVQSGWASLFHQVLLNVLKEKAESSNSLASLFFPFLLPSPLSVNGNPPLEPHLFGLRGEDYIRRQKSLLLLLSLLGREVLLQAPRAASPPRLRITRTQPGIEWQSRFFLTLSAGSPSSSSGYQA